MDAGVDSRRARLQAQQAGPAGLRLLDGFELLCHAQPTSLPMAAQRLLAFLAIQDRPLLRSHVAGRLWPDTTEEHATRSHLQLAAGVVVDYRQALGHAHDLLDEANGHKALDADDGCLSRELLPHWWDDWVVVERERYRQLRMHALEVRCRQLARAGRFARAVQAGLAAVACEPLRDSAHELLISVHLAEGNRAEALRQYHTYCRLLHDELNLAPSPKIQHLVQGLP